MVEGGTDDVAAAREDLLADVRAALMRRTVLEQHPAVRRVLAEPGIAERMEAELAAAESAVTWDEEAIRLSVRRSLAQR